MTQQIELMDIRSSLDLSSTCW